jgi:Domain of unknown function (DUF1905)
VVRSQTAQITKEDVRAAMSETTAPSHRERTLEAERTMSWVDIGAGERFAVQVEPIQFSGEIRYWKPERRSGLAVVDVPGDFLEALGGLKQQRARGKIAAAEFASNVMPAGGGRLALSVSRAMMSAAAVDVGDVVEFEITSVGQD